MNAPAIATENLTRRFGRLTALDGVTFRVGRGELFGVIGPDGAGKTTLMRLLATLSRPDAGRASVLEFDTVRQQAEVRRRVGYMPGRFALYPDLTVAENAPTSRRTTTSSRPSTDRSNASPRARRASCRAE